MLAVVAISVVCAAFAGLVVKWYLDHTDHQLEITWLEFGLGMLAAVFVVAPLTAWLGWKIAVNSLVDYREYWNGWETAAIAEPIRCTRDGPCAHEYDCDPYIVMVSYSCNCDDKGNCSTCTRPETRYHDCPYVTVETNYSIDTTLGGYSINTHRFPENPQASRWRASHSIPEHVIRRAGAGEPPFWTAAKARLDSGAPGPVCKRMSYENYILASERTILKQYSGDVQKFRDAGLFPELTHDVYDFYLADKAYFVGWKPDDPRAWQSSLRYLNAALGTEFEGDLHLVIAQSDAVAGNPDAYVNALRAHWHDTERYGRDAFAKNAIAVVVGTNDGVSIEWARAFTGMPIGNEALTTAVRNELKKTELDFEKFIGAGSVLRKILWGIGNPDTRFQRISMAARDETDKGSGYLYLRDEIQPTTGQLVVIGIVVFILCGGLWLAAAVVGERMSHGSRSRGSFHHRRF